MTLACEYTNSKLVKVDAEENVEILKLKFGLDFVVQSWWRFWSWLLIKICAIHYDMIRSRSYFGKSTQPSSSLRFFQCFRIGEMLHKRELLTPLPLLSVKINFSCVPGRQRTLKEDWPIKIWSICWCWMDTGVVDDSKRLWEKNKISREGTIWRGIQCSGKIKWSAVQSFSQILLRDLLGYCFFAMGWILFWRFWTEGNAEGNADRLMIMPSSELIVFDWC